MNLKKYNLKGEEVGEVEVDSSFLDVDADRQMIKDYLVALRANARQWSANTKGRSEVNHSKKKPYRQKGTGNARQGTLAAPQYKGGGVVFGPKPKFSQHVRINKKERRLAIRHLLSEKIKDSRVVVVEDAVFNEALEAPKTKIIAEFLKGCQCYGKRLLFIGETPVSESQATFFKMSTQNLPKSHFVLAPNLNGYDAIVAQGIVVTESALKEIVELLR